MRAFLQAIAVVVLAGAGWLLRYDVAAEAQVRAIVSAPGVTRRPLPSARGEAHLVSVLEEESNPARRAAAAELLGRATTLDATRALLYALADLDPGVQAAASKTIGAQSSRVQEAIRTLPEDRLVRLLRNCPATPTLYWVFEQALLARPDRAEDLCGAVLPRVGPAHVRWAVAALSRALGALDVHPIDPSPVTVSSAARQRMVACLSAGLASGHAAVRALFALEVARWGGPEPSEDLVGALLAGFRNDSEFHHFFLDAGRRKSPRVEAWARLVVLGNQALGVFWTLLAVDHTLGRECAERLAREGLAGPEGPARGECKRWLDSYGKRGR